MVNYTKYKLKSNEELASLLADKDNLFIIACNKCFKELKLLMEPECGGSLEKILLPKNGQKTVTGSARVEFSVQ